MKLNIFQKILWHLSKKYRIKKWTELADAFKMEEGEYEKFLEEYEKFLEEA